ncbi:hypothetical protein GCM10028777_29140 [Angustibacter speluncae]
MRPGAPAGSSSLRPVPRPTVPSARRCCAALAALALAVGATGCTVRLVDPSASASSAPQTSSSPPPATSAAPVGAELLDRDLLTPGATGRTGCDDAAVRLDETAVGTVVTGRCTLLEVGAAASTVVADDVDRLVVSGDGAQVVVRSAQEVVLRGSTVTVAWESGDPRVVDDGTGNAYGPVGSVEAPPGPRP